MDTDYEARLRLARSMSEWVLAAEPIADRLEAALETCKVRLPSIFVTLGTDCPPLSLAHPAATYLGEPLMSSADMMPPHPTSEHSSDIAELKEMLHAAVSALREQSSSLR